MTTSNLLRRATLVGLLFTAFTGMASQPLPQDLQLVSPELLPTNQATWFSLQKWDALPPAPFNWCSGLDNIFYYQSTSFGPNKVIVDDTAVDYSPNLSSSMMTAETTSSGPPMPPGGGGGGSGGYTNTPGPLRTYGTNDLWLECGFDPGWPGYVELLLHGVTRGSWQLMMKDDLVGDLPWVPGEVIYADGTTNEVAFTHVYPGPDPMIRFYRATGPGSITVSMFNSSTNRAIEPNSSGIGGQTATVSITLSPTNHSQPITIAYRTTGTAVYGVDYTNSPTSYSNGVGFITFPANSGSNFMIIHALYDANVDFDEPAVFSLLPTNGYILDTNAYSATVLIGEAFTNIFEVVATNVPSPVGIDYSSPQQALLLSLNFDLEARNNFAVLHTNGVITNWSTIGDLDPDGGEIKMATAKATASAFTNGDMFFSSKFTGVIGWVSANGAASTTNWVTLTNEYNKMEAFYGDQTGIWSNDLMAVSSGSSFGVQNIWRVHSPTNYQQVASVYTSRLEGALTLPNDSRYGPWAGKFLTGDEDENVIYAVDPIGNVTSFRLGISADAFYLISATNNLYCCDFMGAQSRILKASQNWFTNYVGDILVEQAGETPPNFLPELFILHWNTNRSAFDIHGIPLSDFSHNGDFFEKVCFAPLNIPKKQ